MTADLLNENQISNSAVALAQKASRENASLKRAIESLGCRVHVSDADDHHIADIEDLPADLSPRITSSPNETVESTDDGKTDMSISIAVAADNDGVPGNTSNRICESSCPLWTRDGGCRWPNEGCARHRSQFLGLRANYDAFDRLSIDDGYFQPE